LFALTGFVPEGDMEKYAVKLVVFNDEDFGYWKNKLATIF
jgi:hypothetical protein